MKKNVTANLLLSLLVLAVIGLQDVTAQENTSKNAVSDSNNSTRPSIYALKMNGEESITLDGSLNEIIWQQASIATGFTQRTPNDGEPATEKTEARVIYTNDAVFVGIKAFDSAIDSAAKTLFRKDGSAFSDWVYVSFDSYNDDRTSFNFAVNPKGVRKDILIFNDDNEDIRWDAVWQAKTTIQDDGWTVEMRIPLSQLRYSTNQSIQTWGITFSAGLHVKKKFLSGLPHLKMNPDLFQSMDNSKASEIWKNQPVSSLSPTLLPV